MPDLEMSLMNPNQLRHYGVDVHDNPYGQEVMRIEKSGDSDEMDFVACFDSQGTDIYLDTWTPTPQDLSEYPHVTLTSPLPWDPHEVEFPRHNSATRVEMEARNVLSTRQTGDPLDFRSPDTNSCCYLKL